MWLFNTDPPPGMEADFYEVASLDPQDPVTGGRARTRRGARKPRPPQVPSRIMIAATRAAEIILYRLGRPELAANYNQTLYAIKRELLAGILNPDYWIECNLLDESYLEDEPESVPDPNPRPYAYRVGWNLPTLSTFHTGLNGTAPARYQGFLTGEYFHDVHLTWSRRLYEIPRPFAIGALEPLWHTYIGSQQIDTDERGSRPMTSVIMKFFLTRQDAHPLQIDTPPTDAPLSFYWRYRPPASAATYYHATNPVRLMSDASDERHFLTAQPVNRCVILTAPRPMYGYGQNNCSTIDVSLTGEQKLYQLDS